MAQQSSRTLTERTPAPAGVLGVLAVLLLGGGVGVVAAALKALPPTRGLPLSSAKPPVVASAVSATSVAVPLPQRLSETGFFADNPRRFAYSPQYPLWSDGATKRRFVAVPEGETIDGSQPDEWVVPVGTRFWKDFALDGRRVETRYSEKLVDGSFRFALGAIFTYLHSIPAIENQVPEPLPPPSAPKRG